MSSQTYKIVLIGDGGVGKTSFLQRHINGNFQSKYIATIGVEVHPLTFNTNCGKITLNIWDCAGQEKFGGLREGYYLGADAAIVFFDVTSCSSYKQVDAWIDSFLHVVPNGKIVICGNKCDERDRKIKPLDIDIHKEYNCKYYDISAKTNYNFDKPFLYLARSLTKQEYLNFSKSDEIYKLNSLCSNEFFKQINSTECIKNPSIIQFIDPITEDDKKVKDLILRIHKFSKQFTIQLPTITNNLVSIAYGHY